MAYVFKTKFPGGEEKTYNRYDRVGLAGGRELSTRNFGAMRPSKLLYDDPRRVSMLILLSSHCP